MAKTRFDWDPEKDRENQSKHGVSFTEAEFAFTDPRRVIAEDLSHSSSEKRYYCFGEVGGWRAHRTLYLPRRSHSNLWRRLLAKGQTHL
jgi:uncharacterized DUF497 family protein